MLELLKRLWVEGMLPEARVRAAIEAAVARGIISREQADEVLAMERQI